MHNDICLFSAANPSEYLLGESRDCVLGFESNGSHFPSTRSYAQVVWQFQWGLSSVYQSMLERNTAKHLKGIFVGGKGKSHCL